MTNLRTTDFRVFFEDGSTFDCAADSPAEARDIARRRHDKPIAKVKVIRDGQS